VALVPTLEVQLRFDPPPGRGVGCPARETAYLSVSASIHGSRFMGTVRWFAQVSVPPLQPSCKGYKMYAHWRAKWDGCRF
jgi:hypothetical protein